MLHVRDEVELQKKNRGEIKKINYNNVSYFGINSWTFINLPI